MLAQRKCQHKPAAVSHSGSWAPGAQLNGLKLWGFMLFRDTGEDIAEEEMRAVGF